MERILALSDFSTDPTAFNNSLKDLVKLAAMVAGTEISLVNLIDAYTQWSVSAYGLEIEQMPREDSVCQYTIMGDQPHEVKDLDTDARFKDKFYVVDAPNVKYYFGVPLKYEQYNLGALCMLDKQNKTLSPEKVEMLEVIAEEVVNRLKVHKYIDQLRDKIKEVKNTQNKVMHDIRGPIAGIIGLAEIINEQGRQNDLDQVLEFINMIHKGGKSVLELADDILTTEKSKKQLKANELNLHVFREKLERLYVSQARSKNVELAINISEEGEPQAFPQSKLMQIAGNLISNAIKFAPRFGKVTVLLSITSTDSSVLNISVTDTGEGMDEQRIAQLLGDNSVSTDGTAGETGYGFGLQLVKHLVKAGGGSLSITSQPGAGAQFTVTLPLGGK